MDEHTITLTNRLRTDVDRLEKLVNNWAYRFTKLMTDVDQIQEDIAALKGRIGRINELMGQLGER